MAPRADPAARHPSGYLSDEAPARRDWALAVTVALAAAIAFEWIAARTPVPPGGDEGTWLLLSYPYVGIAAPSSVHLFSYPPLSLPFLGLAVAAAGGPLTGARLFVGVVLVALGLSAFQLGRAMFRSTAVALLFEGALLFQPDFQQLQYFGAYPNLFGFVFFFLALAFCLRYLRSRRDLHLGLFWGAATAAVLSHALVAVVLIALIGIGGLALLAVRRFPRELFATAVGRIGAATFAALALLYYAGTWLAATPRPDYLYTTILTPAQSTQQLGDLFHAFYLEPLSVVLHLGGFSFGSEAALGLLWGLSATLVLGFALVHRGRPHWISERAVLVVAWFLSVFVVALVSWYLDLTADYRRFTFFLYPANLLIIGLAGDVLLAWLGDGRVEPASERARDAVPARHDRPARWATVVVAVAAIALLAGAAVYSVPAAVQFDDQNSHLAHGSDFLAAMHGISSSGIAGAIFSTTPIVDRWPTALTGHALYEVRPPTGYTYTANNLQTDELAAITASYRGAVTNGQQVLAVPGTTPYDLNATPAYGYYLDGLVRSVFDLAPSSIDAVLANGSVSQVDPAAGATLTWQNSSTAGAVPTMVLGLAAPPLSVTVTATAWANSTATIRLIAAASGTSGIVALTANLTGAGVGSGGAHVTNPAHAVWNASASAGALSTYANVSAGASLTQLNGSLVRLAAQSATPVPALSIELTVSTPGASNPVATGTISVDTAALWQQWGVRFVLLWNGTATTGSTEATYLEREYAASLFSENGAWTVLLWNGGGAIGYPPNDAGST